MQPKVSIVIPVYNVEKYLRECLDSAINQTLEEIEIICVNDGSTDSSLEILREYEARDPRVHVIDKPNAGFGHTMNMGLNAATGEYVAFLESDDSMNKNAYKRLVEIADSHGLDIVKGDYFNLEGIGDNRRLEPVEITKVKERYGKIFRPLDEPWSFYVPMMNVLGLFRRSMLEENHIRHNETPGASHQDMGFWFQTLAVANTMMFVNEPFYEYRQDNMNASMKSDKTTFCILNEYAFIRNFLEAHPSLKDQALPIFFHRKFGSSMFSYSRAELSLRLPFLRQLAHEYEQDIDEGVFTFERFNENDTKKLKALIEDPDLFYIESLGVADTGAIKRLTEEIATTRLQLQHLQADQANKDLLPEASETNNNAEEALDLSIIIPVYNAADYLKECIQSILDQSMENYEIICIDDGSTDNSPLLLTELTATYPQIKVLLQKNRGQGAARNVGINLARGRYIHFVDSDDKLAKEGYSEIFNRAMEADLDALFFDGATFYDSEELAEQFKSFKTTYTRALSHEECVSGIEMFKQFKRENTYRVSPCLALFKRSFLNENGLRFPEGVIYEDNAFMLKALCTAQRVAHINDPLYLRRIREGSTMTTDQSAKNARSYFEVYLDMLQFALDGQWDYETDKYVADELRSIASRIRSIYRKLDDSERLALCSLPPVRESVLDLAVAQTSEQLRREKAEQELKKKQANADRETKKLKKDLEKIKASNSWKIGRKVTAPARALKRTVKR